MSTPKRLWNFSDLLHRDRAERRSKMKHGQGLDVSELARAREFATALLRGWDIHKRDLPWRRSRDPYTVWVSEIMLQQTQAQTAIPYFERWMEHFPTVQSLAAADEQEALAYWQGLGYYRRCKMLLSGAREVVSNGMPANAAEWLKVPGVGRYTAGAIASICLGEAVPLVDGNVERVFARLTGNESVGRSLTRAAWFWAERSLNRTRPGDHNEALMDLGATVCKPQDPLCQSCPLRHACLANLTNSQERFPAPRTRRNVVQLSQTVSVPYCNGRFGVRQIPEGQWWEGMWEFRRLPAAGGVPQGVLIGTLKHVVTHHRVRLGVFLDRASAQDPALRWLTAEELKALPMPTPQRKALSLAVKALDEPTLFDS